MISKVLVTGSSGILGRVLYDKLLDEPDFVTYGLVFNRTTNAKKIKCDLRNETEVNLQLDSLKPDLIVHCAAERRPEIVSQNKTQAQSLNVGSTEFITKWAKENNARVLYISSDYVFDGTNPPYNEEAVPNPLNDYGVMKLQSEQLVINSNNANVVLRLPILYGIVEYLEECAVTILFKKVLDSSMTAPMSNYEKRFPTHCEDVAQTIVNMVKYLSKNGTGLPSICHYQAEEEMTKLEMSLKMAEVFCLPSNHIVPENPPTGTEATKRPFKSQLNCEKLKKLGLYHQPRTFSAGIKESLKTFLN